MNEAVNSIERPSPSIPPPSPSAFSVLTTPTPIASRRGDNRRIRGQTWLLVGRKPNLKRGQQVSPIWDHGDEYVDLAKPQDGASWICDHCDAIVTLKSNASTSNAARHLKNFHQISGKRPRSEIEDEEEEERTLSRQSSLQEIPRPPGFTALVTRLDIEKFRRLLLRWIIQQQIPYSAVEHIEFRDLLLYLQPSLEPYLIRSHRTISNWVADEFKEAQLAVKSLLAQAKSRIHLSFDIWTSPSAIPILGVCAHFLDSSLQLKHPLLGLKFIEGSHTGEAIAAIIEALIYSFDIEPKLGVFIADNASNCDTACESLVKRLRPNEDENSRRSRCLGHIINLAAQAFIYGKKNETFIVEAEQVEQLTIRDEQALIREQSLWRTRGSFGKFHNVVKFIRASYLRRREFQAVVEMVVAQSIARGDTQSTDDNEFGPLKPDLNVILDNSTRWNSAFSSIKRGLRLKEPLKAFLRTNPDIPEADILTDED
jgi:hypothetical protein